MIHWAAVLPFILTFSMTQTSTPVPTSKTAHSHPSNASTSNSAQRGNGSINIGTNYGAVTQVLRATADKAGDSEAWDRLLLPGKEPAPKSWCDQLYSQQLTGPGIQPLFVYFAAGSVACSGNHCALLTMTEQETGKVTDLVSVDRLGTGLVANIKIYSKDGQLALDLKNNKPYKNDAVVKFTERTAENALEVLDSRGNLLLRIRYLNPTAIAFEGTFYPPAEDGAPDPDSRLQITKDFMSLGRENSTHPQISRANCAANASSAFDWLY